MKFQKQTAQLSPTAFSYGYGLGIAQDSADPEFRPEGGGGEKRWSVTVQYKPTGGGATSTSKTIQAAASKEAAVKAVRDQYGARFVSAEATEA